MDSYARLAGLGQLHRIKERIGEEVELDKMEETLRVVCDRVGGGEHGGLYDLVRQAGGDGVRDAQLGAAVGALFGVNAARGATNFVSRDGRGVYGVVPGGGKAGEERAERAKKVDAFVEREVEARRAREEQERVDLESALLREKEETGEGGGDGAPDGDEAYARAMRGDDVDDAMRAEEDDRLMRESWEQDEEGGGDGAPDGDEAYARAMRGDDVDDAMRAEEDDRLMRESWEQDEEGGGDGAPDGDEAFARVMRAEEDERLMRESWEQGEEGGGEQAERKFEDALREEAEEWEAVMRWRDDSEDAWLRVQLEEFMAEDLGSEEPGDAVVLPATQGSVVWDSLGGSQASVEEATRERFVGGLRWSPAAEAAATPVLSRTQGSVVVESVVESPRDAGGPIGGTREGSVKRVWQSPVQAKKASRSQESPVGRRRGDVVEEEELQRVLEISLEDERESGVVLPATQGSVVVESVVGSQQGADGPDGGTREGGVKRFRQSPALAKKMQRFRGTPDGPRGAKQGRIDLTTPEGAPVRKVGKAGDRIGGDGDRIGPLWRGAGAAEVPPGPAGRAAAAWLRGDCPGARDVRLVAEPHGDAMRILERVGWVPEDAGGGGVDVAWARGLVGYVWDRNSCYVDSMLQLVGAVRGVRAVVEEHSMECDRAECLLCCVREDMGGVEARMSATGLNRGRMRPEFARLQGGVLAQQDMHEALLDVLKAVRGCGGLDDVYRTLGVGWECAAACGRCGEWTGWHVEGGEPQLEVRFKPRDGLSVSDGLAGLLDPHILKVRGERDHWIGVWCRGCVKGMRQEEWMRRGENARDADRLQDEARRIPETAAFAARFRRLPPVLVVQVERFRVVGWDDQLDAAITEKDTAEVKVDPELTLTEWCGEDGQRAVAVTYRAKLVVLHDGKTLALGHYTVLMLGTDGRWYHMDGARRALWGSGLRGIGRDAYCVLYERVGSVAGDGLARLAPFPSI